MARSVLVDAGFLVAMLSRRDSHHRWAVKAASQNTPPWYTCEVVLFEAYHLLGEQGAAGLRQCGGSGGVLAEIRPRADEFC